MFLVLQDIVVETSNEKREVLYSTCKETQLCISRLSKKISTDYKEESMYGIKNWETDSYL